MLFFYSAKGDVTENISKLTVENGSSLLIHGQANYSHTRNYYEPTLLNSQVLTKEGAVFTLFGPSRCEGRLRCRESGKDENRVECLRSLHGRCKPEWNRQSED